MQTRAVERRPERPASSEGREQSRQTQSALSTGAHQGPELLTGATKLPRRKTTAQLQSGEKVQRRVTEAIG